MYVHFFKRVIDFLVALCALPFFCVIYIVLAPFYFFMDRGPMFYSGKRLGQYGKSFPMHKFRSMKVNAPDIRLKDGSTYNGDDDSRVTKLGRFIRKTSLDEIPQILNVLKGDMSLVGPRPALPEEVALYGSLYSTRLLVKPGITGPWQISGRSDLTQKQSEYADVSYIQDWSITGDIAILLKTVVAVFKGTGSY